MTREEQSTLKKISIRGRFAYGLWCLEELAASRGNSDPALTTLINKLWKVTESETLGWWEDLLVEHNPKVMIPDYIAFKEGRVSLRAIDLSTIDTATDFAARAAFLQSLEEPIPELLDKLAQIANQNLFAGTEIYSELTYQSTTQLIEILDAEKDYDRPGLEIVAFSKFSGNDGWGIPFPRAKIVAEQNVK
ncbi:hypothetical protein [Flavilitoribacter nigricans]|uniref:Uncharacterized protein n=1 Tax=Flavilitoribacter nigricans (strain ATCC 23147 / DSM 23189 / NBRC 102662 / NCIMB 1420 / SS-2) TaxID=1122177 RepID=A0A2D0N7V2_FLAN2|nr:hypothetical protein [Flavilitoribacter nigricans]PHN04592.1 hypothetical protein CRP01_21545 [Flavilitoribacter nigricans DSM 23189 = NBRC 102662]